MSSASNTGAGRPSPQLLDLQKPAKLSEVLKDDKDDCLSCRLLGSAAFVGLGGFVYISGRAGLRERKHEILKRGTRIGMRGRLASLTMLSSTLVGIGLYRLMI